MDNMVSAVKITTIINSTTRSRNVITFFAGEILGELTHHIGMGAGTQSRRKDMWNLLASFGSGGRKKGTKLCLTF